MRQIFLTVVIISSVLNLTGCGEGGPDIGQVGQVVSQVAGLMGKIQGSSRGTNAEAKQQSPLAQQGSQVVPVRNAQVPKETPLNNVQVQREIPIQNSQKSELDKEPEISITTKENSDVDRRKEEPNQNKLKKSTVQEMSAQDQESSKNQFADEPLLANFLEENSPTT